MLECSACSHRYVISAQGKEQAMQEDPRVSVRGQRQAGWVYETEQRPRYQGLPSAMDGPRATKRQNAGREIFEREKPGPTRHLAEEETQKCRAHNVITTGNTNSKRDRRRDPRPMKPAPPMQSRNRPCRLSLPAAVDVVASMHRKTLRRADLGKASMRPGLSDAGRSARQVWRYERGRAARGAAGQERPVLARARSRMMSPGPLLARRQLCDSDDDDLDDVGDEAEMYSPSTYWASL